MLSGDAHRALAGAERIIHAGDVGGQAVLDDLARIAPVSAVEGNTDRGWSHGRLPVRLVVQCGDRGILVGHKLPELVRGGVPEGVHIVVYGHTHVAAAREIDGILYVNPGSACQPRDGSAPSVAVIDIAGERLSVRHVFF